MSDDVSTCETCGKVTSGIILIGKTGDMAPVARICSACYAKAADAAGMSSGVAYTDAEAKRNADEKRAKELPDDIALLRFHSPRPLYALVRHKRYAHNVDTPLAERADNARYWFNDGTCPTNWFPRDVVELFHGCEPDPHGAFQLVGLKPEPELVAALRGGEDTLASVEDAAADQLGEAFGVDFADELLPRVDYRELKVNPYKEAGDWTFLGAVREAGIPAETRQERSSYRARVAFLGGPQDGQRIELDVPHKRLALIRMKRANADAVNQDTHEYQLVRSIVGHHVALYQGVTETTTKGKL